jgi:hypothetical protein
VVPAAAGLPAPTGLPATAAPAAQPAPVDPQDEPVEVKDRILGTPLTTTKRRTRPANDFDKSMYAYDVYMSEGMTQEANDVITAYGNKHAKVLEEADKRYEDGMNLFIATRGQDKSGLKKANEINPLSVDVDMQMDPSGSGKMAVGVNARGTKAPGMFRGPEGEASQTPIWMDPREAMVLARGIGNGGTLAALGTIVDLRGKVLEHQAKAQGMGVQLTQLAQNAYQLFQEAEKQAAASGGTPPDVNTFMSTLANPADRAGFQSLVSSGGGRGLPGGTGGSQPSQGSGGSDFAMGPKQQTVQSTLSAGGLAAPVVAGALGNFHVEGGYGGAKGDGGKSGGIAQWKDERAALFKQMHGVDPASAPIEMQAKHFLWELNNPVKSGAFVGVKDGRNPWQQAAAVKAAKTPGEAATLIDRYYERSSGAHRGKRVAAANAAFGGGGGGSTSGGPGLPQVTSTDTAPTGEWSGLASKPDPRYAQAVQFKSKPLVDAGVARAQENADQAGNQYRAAAAKAAETANAPLTAEQGEQAYNEGRDRYVGNYLNNLAEGDRALLTPFLLPNAQQIDKGGKPTKPSEAVMKAGNPFAVNGEEQGVYLMRQTLDMKDKPAAEISFEMRQNRNALGALRKDSPGYHDKLMAAAKKLGPLGKEPPVNPAAKKAKNMFAVDTPKAVSLMSDIMPYMTGGGYGMIPSTSVKAKMKAFDELRKLDPTFAEVIERKARAQYGKLGLPAMSMGLGM